MASEPIRGPLDRFDAKGVEQALTKLKDIASHLRLLALLVVSATFVNMLATSIGLVLRSTLGISTSILVTTGVLTLGVMILVVLFETDRKEGDALFKEISDELQWNVRFSGGMSPESAPPEKRPNLNYRFALRLFAQSTDLPLTPGRYGPLAYLLINLMVTSFTIFALTVRHSA